MRESFETIKDKLEYSCLSYDDSDTKTLKAACAQIKKFELSQQIKFFNSQVGEYPNILTRNLSLRPLNFHYIFNVVKDFPGNVLEPLLLGLDNHIFKRNALMHAVNWDALDNCRCVALVCELTKKIPLASRINIFKQNSGGNKTVLIAALNSVYLYRNPQGASNNLYWERDSKTAEEAITKSHAYFEAVVGPLLEVMKDFPLKVKEELYNAIPNSLWYLNRFPEEKQRINSAIGVHRPFSPIQKAFFSASAGATLMGGALWLLIAAGVITVHAFVMIAWPIAVTATTVGLSTMLALNLYAKCNNPIVPYAPVESEEARLLEGKGSPRCD